MTAVLLSTYRFFHDTFLLSFNKVTALLLLVILLSMVFLTLAEREEKKQLLLHMVDEDVDEEEEEVEEERRRRRMGRRDSGVSLLSCSTLSREISSSSYIKVI